MLVTFYTFTATWQAAEKKMGKNPNLVCTLKRFFLICLVDLILTPKKISHDTKV